MYSLPAAVATKLSLPSISLYSCDVHVFDRVSPCWVMSLQPPSALMGHCANCIMVSYLWNLTDTPSYRGIARAMCKHYEILKQDLSFGGIQRAVLDIVWCPHVYHHKLCYWSWPCLCVTVGVVHVTVWTPPNRSQQLCFLPNVKKRNIVVVVTMENDATVWTLTN